MDITGAEAKSVPAWTIINIEDQVTFTPGAGPVRVKRVYFALYNGTASFVDIPFDKFSPQEVNRQVDSHAANLADVSALQGQMVTLPG